MLRRRAISLLMLVGVALVLSSCRSPAGSGNGLRVVAAENFWGNIAAQIAGAKATVQSVIVNPNQDPHSYTPDAQDARAFATARLVIDNGIGYDPWAPQLLAANPADGRTVLTVGGLFGLTAGDNPHQWYDPAHVVAVAAAIATRLARIDPPDAKYFATRLRHFEDVALAPYDALIAQIRARFAGTPVGASESIFVPLAAALGLRLLTPPSLMKAVSEGTEVTAQDEIAAQQQIQRHAIAVWVYNAQNATPEIQRLNALAKQAHIPIATITETLSPARDSFVQWQVLELLGLERALARAARA